MLEHLSKMAKEAVDKVEESYPMKIIIFLLTLFVGISGWLTSYVVSANDEKTDGIESRLTKEIDLQRRELEVIRQDQQNRSARIAYLEAISNTLDSRLQLISSQMEKISDRLSVISVKIGAN